MKRSVGVTVIAVLSLIGSVLTLLLGIGVALVAVFVPIPNQNAAMSPALFKTIFVLSSLFYIGPGIWGIFTSVGLFRLKNWARISIIVFSVLLVAMSLFGVLTALVMPLPPGPGQTQENALVLARWFMGLFASVHAGIGVWWIVFFTRPKVQIQFVRVQSTSTEQEAQYLSPQAGPSSVPEIAPRSTRPLSITIIAWLLLLGSIFMPLNLLLHTPAVFLTWMLTGWGAVAIYIAFTAANLYVGVGLLRLRSAARIAGIAYFLFGFVNMAAFYLTPGGQGRMQMILEKQQAMYPWAQAWQGQNMTLTDLKPLMILGACGAIVGFSVPLYFLITRHRAFERNAALIPTSGTDTLY